MFLKLFREKQKQEKKKTKNKKYKKDEKIVSVHSNRELQTHTTLLKHIVTQRENERMRERKRQKREREIGIITNCDNASEERKSVQHF